MSVNEHKAKLEQDFTVRFETVQKAMLQEMQKHMDAFDKFREQPLQENKSLRAELNSQRLTTNDLIDQTMQLGKTWQMKMLHYLIKSKHLNMNLVTYPTFKVGLMNNWKPLMSLEDSWIDPPLPIHNLYPLHHLGALLGLTILPCFNHYLSPWTDLLTFRLLMLKTTTLVVQRYMMA